MLKKLTPEKLDEILQVGIEEFAHLGLEKANVNIIAKKAGVSIGVLYKYYPNKNEFFFACVKKALRKLDDLLTTELSMDNGPEENAEKLIRAAVEFSKEEPDTVILYHRITCFEEAELAKKMVKEIEGKTAEYYRSIMEEYQKAGKIRDEIDAGYLAMLFDDILMMLQFSIACQYYRYRQELYTGQQTENNEEALIAAARAFVRQAFSINK